MLKMSIYDFVLLGLWETATMTYSEDYIDLKIQRYSHTLNVSYTQTDGKKAGFNMTLIPRFNHDLITDIGVRNHIDRN